MPERQGLRGRRVHLILATSTGGVGRHVHGLAAASVIAGTDTTVHGPQATEDLFAFTRTGAAFNPVEIASGVAPRADTVAWRALRQALPEADLVHAHGLRAGLIAGLALPRRRSGDARPAYVVTWHNALLDDTPVRPLHTPIERVIARAGDVIIAVSGDLAERARSLGAADVRVVPVGGPRLPAPTRSRDDVRHDLGVSGPIVLTVGRLHRQKGIDVLIRAATDSLRANPRPVLVVAGEGPERSALQLFANELDVPLLLLGQRSDIADLLGAADVVVLPSRWEGSPLAAREALAAGRPLVATTVGGVPDLVDSSAARLVAPDDPAALGAAIAGLLAAPAEAAALGEAGRRAADRWPDEAATTARVLDVYADLLEASR